MQTDNLTIVKARITMKTTAEGGRQHGFTSGYRPNHVFELPDHVQTLTAFVGDIQFDDQEFVEPGESKIVTVRFLKTPKIEQYMRVGQKWFINEGGRTLGFAEILEIADNI